MVAQQETPLNRYLLLTCSDSTDDDYKITCTGFISTPSVLFDPYSSCPKHTLTILDHTVSPPQMSTYLPLKLLSMDSILSFKRKCTTISCGFEHCLALVEGKVFSWGFGGSGCLGHGNYESIMAPKEVKELAGNVTSVEAGGYHNCAVMADHKVMVWGRGDVG